MDINKIIENFESNDSAKAILVAARDEFAEHGLEGARVDRIAERSGINKAMIYYYFRSKEKLYEIMLEAHIGLFAKFAELKIDQEPTPEVFFEALAKHIGTILQNNKTFIPIFLREVASGTDRLHRIYKKILIEGGLTEKLKGIIEQGKAEGRFRDVSTKQALLSFMGMNMFYLLVAPIANLIWEIENEDDFRKERPEAVADLFLHGLLK